MCLEESPWKRPGSDLRISSPMGRWFTDTKRHTIPTCCRTKDALYYRDEDTQSISKYTLKGQSGFFKYDGEVTDIPEEAHPVNCRFVDGDKLWTSRKYRPTHKHLPERKRPGIILHDNLIRNTSTIKHQRPKAQVTGLSSEMRKS